MAPMGSEEDVLVDPIDRDEVFADDLDDLLDVGELSPQEYADDIDMLLDMDLDDDNTFTWDREP